MQVYATVITDAGLIRQGNEDNYFILDCYKESLLLNHHKVCRESEAYSQVYAVCDGLGGENAGEIASLRAVETLAALVKKEYGQETRQWISDMNKSVCEESHNGGNGGSTLAMLRVSGSKIGIYNVGDSRIYRLKRGRLKQLSHDHSAQQQRVDMGIDKKKFLFMGKNTNKTVGRRNIVTQYLGISPEKMLIEPYVMEQIKVKKGDIFLVCSDGLTDMVPDEEIQKVLAEGCTIQQKADILLAAALHNGGKDNVTILLLEIVDT